MNNRMAGKRCWAFLAGMPPGISRVPLLVGLWILMACTLTVRASAAAIASNQSGNWNDGSTWVGGVPPGSGDVVTIASTHTITVTAGAAANTITIAANGSGSNGIIINSGITLAVAGAVTMTSPTSATTSTINVGDGTLTAASIAIPGSATGGRNCVVTVNTGTISTTGSITFSGTAAQAQFASTGASTVNVAGNFGSGGTLTTSGTGTINFNGGSAQTIGTYTTYNNIAINNSSGGVTTSGTTTFGGTLTVTTGTLTNNGTLTVTGAVSGAGSLVQGANATLNLAGTVSITTFTATASPNTVSYNGGSQTVFPTTYHHLTLGGSGTETLTNVSTINGNLTTSGTCTATTAIAMTVGGNLTVGNNTTFTVAGFNFTVTGTTTVTGTLAHSSATGTKIYTGLVSYGGSWTNAGNSDITFRGGLTRSSGGSFSSGSGTYTFDTNNQAISGSQSISIGNVSVTGVVLTNNSTSTFTVSTALSGTGSFVQGSNATLSIGGTSGISTLTATASGNTVNYSGAAQTVVPTTYYHLTLSGSGTKALTGLSTINGDLTASGTASSTAPGALTIGGNVVLGSGTTFNASSYSHSVGGNWTNNGATFTASTSTFTMNGTTAQTLGGSGSSAFNNLTIANTSATVSANTNFSVGGTLTVNASAVLSPASGVVVSGAGTLTGSGTVQVTRATGSADFINQYTIAATLTNLTVEFTGASVQGTGSITYGGLKINTASSVLLSADVTVNATLTLTSGYIATSANKVIVSSTGTVSRTGGWVNGNLQKWVVTGGTSITFEVGDSGNYAPVNLVFGNVSVAGDLVVNQTSGDHPDIDNSGVNYLKGVNDWWTLTNSGVVFDSYSATFNFAYVDIDGGSNTSAFNIAKKLSGTWTSQTVGTRTGTSTQATGVTSFGDFVIGETPPGVTKTWDGGAGTNNWGDANNWNPDGVPGSTDDASLTGANTITIDVSAVCRDVILNNSGLTLTVQSGKTITTSGSVKVMAGTFSTGSNTITVKGDWINNGGTFTPGGGTVVFGGTAAQAIYGSAATQTFNHITLNCSGQTLTVGGSTTTLTVNGALTLTAGTLDAGTASAINVAGNWTNNASSSSFTAGMSTVSFIGTGGQTLGGSSSTSFNSLTLANTAAALTANTNFNVAGTLTVNANGTLSPASAVVINSSSTQGTITGSGTVQVTRTSGAGYTSQYKFTTNTLTNLTVQYNGTSSQSVSNVTYGNLQISNSSGTSLGGTTTISGTLTIDASASLSTSSSGLTVSGATSVSGTLTIASTSGSKTFGDLVINNGGLMNFTAAENIAENGNLQVDGTGTISGTQGTWTFQKSGGGGTLSGSATSTTLTNATFTQNYAASGTWVVSGTLSVSFGVLLTNNCTSLTVGTALSGIGGLTQGANATLNLGGTAGITTLTATANPNTVTYNGAAQTVHANTYHHLTLSGSGAKTLTSVSTVNGDLTLSGTCTAATAAALSVAGNLTVGTGTAITVAGFNFTVTGTTSLTGTLDHSSATGTKTYTGLVTINSGGVWTNSGNSAINYRGGLTNNGTTFTSGSGVYTFDTNTQAVGGTTALSIASVTVTGITLTNNCSSLTIGTALSGSGGLTQTANATLLLGGTAGITTLTATASPNTVNYNGAGQTVHANTYHHLTLSGSGAKTLTSVSTVNGDLTLSGTCTAATAAALSVGGNLTVGTGTALTVAGFNFTITGTTSLTGTLDHSSATGTKTYTGLVTINSGGVWTNTGNSGINYRGGLTYNGTTFTSGSGVYTFDTNTQAVGGTTALSIASVTVTGVTLTNNCASLTIGTALSGSGGLTQTANGTLNLGGTSGITTLTATASPNTVNYNGAGQTVHANTYHHLTLSGSGTKALTSVSTVNGDLTFSGTCSAATAAALSVGGNLTVGTGTALTVAGFNFTVTGTTSLTGTLDHSSATGTKTYTGLVTINSGGVWTNSGNSAINYRGGLTHNGTTFTSGSGVYTFDTNTQAVGGTTSLSIASVTVTGITLTNNCSSLTIGTALSGSGGLTQTANGTLDLGGTSGITTLTATASPNTVNYNGAGQTVHANTYHHLALSGSGTKTMPGSTLTVGGDFTMSGTASATAGAAVNVTGNFSVGSSAAFDASNFSHTVGGTFTNDNTFTASTSTVTFNGSSGQTLVGATPTAFNNLTLNNGNGLTLSVNATINGTLTFTNGKITTGSNKVVISSTGSVSRTSGYVAGNMQKYITTGATSKTFEIGDASNYTPVDISFGNVTTPGDLTAKTTAGDHPNVATSAVLPAKSVNRYWSVTNNGVAFNSYNATFTFVAGDVDAGANTGIFIVAKYDGSWTRPTVGSRTSTTTQATGMTTFSDYESGEPSQVTKVWDGGAGTNSWGDAANWNPDGVPVSTDDVDLSGANTIDINVAAQCQNIILNNASLILTILAGNSLTASGNFTLTDGTCNTEGSFPSVSGTTSISGGTFGYTGTSTQTVAAVAYYNLSFANGGTKNISSSLTASGSLIINAGAPVSVAGAVTLHVNGTVTNAGSFANSGTTLVGP